jgi:A/G-specific adenine glycosylase
MELGALVCAPRNPGCSVCPLGKVCKAFARGIPERYPVKKKKVNVPHKIVGAGVVIRRDGRILIAQRKETSMLGGLWEFPGGTLEKGETMPECIRRELEEELGIKTRIGPRILVVHHAYSHFTIDLHVHWARIAKGRPRAIHCAAFAWVKPARMKRHPFSKADLQIVQCLEKWDGNFPRVGRRSDL